jgi:hypothetical protein
MSSGAVGTPMTSPGGHPGGEDPILEPVNGQVYPPTTPRKDCPGRMTNQVSMSHKLSPFVADAAAK